MQILHKALLLKKMYLLQNFGFEYVEPKILQSLQKSFDFKNLGSLCGAINSCTLCKHRNSKAHVGIINSNSKLMFVSLFPILDNENRFTSKGADMLLNIIKKVLNLEMQEVSITSLIKCEMNMTYSKEGFSNCQDYFLKQLEFSNAQKIVCLGSEAYGLLCDVGLRYEESQGRFLKWNGYDLFPTFSISQLLRQPKLKIQAHKEFLTIKGSL